MNKYSIAIFLKQPKTICQDWLYRGEFIIQIVFDDTKLSVQYNYLNDAWLPGDVCFCKTQNRTSKLLPEVIWLNYSSRRDQLLSRVANYLLEKIFQYNCDESVIIDECSVRMKEDKINGYCLIKLRSKNRLSEIVEE